MPEKLCCNLCGTELDYCDIQEDFTFSKHLGYGTRYDGSDLLMRLCCHCMEKLIDGCVVPPLEDLDKTLDMEETEV